MILPQNPTFSGFGCCLSPVSSAKIQSLSYSSAMTLAMSFSVRCFHSDRQRCFWRPSQCGSSGGSDMVEEKVGVQTCKWQRQQLPASNNVIRMFQRYHWYFADTATATSATTATPGANARGCLGASLCCLRTLLLLPPPSHQRSHTYNEPSIYHDISIKVSSHTTFAFTMSYIFGKLMHQRSIQAIWKPYQCIL